MQIFEIEINGHIKFRYPCFELNDDKMDWRYNSLIITLFFVNIIWNIQISLDWNRYTALILIIQFWLILLILMQKNFICIITQRNDFKKVKIIHFKSESRFFKSKIIKLRITYALITSKLSNRLYNKSIGIISQ